MALMETNQKFSVIAIGIGLFCIGGIVWWSAWGTSQWFPAGFQSEHREVRGSRTIQEQLLSETASGEAAPVSTQEREAIIKQLTNSSGAAASDRQAILNAWAPSE